MSVPIKPDNINFTASDESFIHFAIGYFNNELKKPWNINNTYKDIAFFPGLVPGSLLSEKETKLLLDDVASRFEFWGWYTHRPSYNHIVFSSARQGIKDYKKDHRDNFLWFLGILFVLGVIINLVILAVFK